MTLVFTPVQALRCRIIQTLPPAGRRALSCPNQDKSLCLSASPFGKGSTHTSFTRWCDPPGGKHRQVYGPPSTFTFPTTLGDLSTSPYVVLGDCADHRACLRFQPCSRTGRPVSMPCSGTVLTTEHDYIPNRARRLINHSLRCAQDLLRLLSNHSLGIGWDNFNFLDLATRLTLRLPASSETTSVRCIWRCISVSDFLCGFCF